MEFGVVERFALEYIRSHSLAFSFFRYHVTPILFKRTHVSVYILRRECAFIHSILQTPHSKLFNKRSYHDGDSGEEKGNDDGVTVETGQRKAEHRDHQLHQQARRL